MAIVTVAQALKKLYKTIVGEDTKKNNPTKIIVELADHWPGTGGGGGGGSSDYSTATVTLTGGVLEGLWGAFQETDSTGPIATSTIAATIILYKGSAHLVYTGSEELTLSGNIHWDETLSEYVVTGDCTITTGNPK